MRVEWLRSEARAECPVCGETGVKPAVLTTDHVLPDHPRVTFLRCPACGSAFLDDLATPDYENEMPEMLDYYIEQGAGIDLIVAPLVRLPAGSVRRCLEIGCSFGFALDFSRHTFGWDVLGVDPSELAKAGTVALDLPILSTYFDAQLDVGSEPFELGFCSEILEHVPDPHSLLAAIRSRLSPDGLLILSTPNVDIVRPSTEEGSLGRALSPGLHLILYGRHSLALLLAKAGFTDVHIEESPETLHAYASCSPVALAQLRPDDPAALRALLRNYFDARASTAPPASTLACGFAYRHFKECVNTGLYDQAVLSRERLAHIYRQRFGLELDRAESLEEDADPFPFNLTGTLFFSGILELNHLGNADRAAAYFAAAAHAGQLMHASQSPLGLHDGETEGLASQSRKHLPMALAAADPDRALVALQSLADDLTFPRTLLFEARMQTFVRLVNASALDAAEQLAPQVLELLDLPSLAAHGETTAGALDPVYCLAMLALHRGRHAEAAERFRFVFRSASVKGVPERASLLWSARYHEALSLRQSGEEASALALFEELAHDRSDPMLPPIPSTIADAARMQLNLETATT